MITADEFHLSQVSQVCDSSRCRFTFAKLHKTIWTVSTRVWLCTSVNMYTKQQLWVCLKRLPAIRTLTCCEHNVSYLLKHLLHSEHLYGLCPMWTLSVCVNALSRMWHLYGFYPLWILLWSTTLSVVNRLLQTVHSNGFSPEWLCPCTVIPLLLWQHLPHSVHLHLFYAFIVKQVEVLVR